MFYFHPYLGKIPILTNIFLNGLKPPTRHLFLVLLKVFGENNESFEATWFLGKSCSEQSEFKSNNIL